MMQILVISITIIFVLLLLVRDIVTYKEIKDKFTCKYCNTLNKELSNGHQCSECGRVFRNTFNVWDHRALFKITCIDTNNKKINYVYKEVIKTTLKEIIIYIIFVIILTTSLIITIV